MPNQNGCLATNDAGSGTLRRTACEMGYFDSNNREVSGVQNDAKILNPIVPTPHEVATTQPMQRFTVTLCRAWRCRPGVDGKRTGSGTKALAFDLSKEPDCVPTLFAGQRNGNLGQHATRVSRRRTEGGGWPDAQRQRGESPF